MPCSRGWSSTTRGAAQFAQHVAGKPSRRKRLLPIRWASSRESGRSAIGQRGALVEVGSGAETRRARAAQDRAPTARERFTPCSAGEISSSGGEASEKFSASRAAMQPSPRWSRPGDKRDPARSGSEHPRDAGRGGKNLAPAAGDDVAVFLSSCRRTARYSVADGGEKPFAAISRPARL